MTSHLLETYPPFPFTIDRGEGVYIYDTNKNRYLDLYGGHCVSLLGHNPKIIIDAIGAQANTIYFYSMAGKLDIREEAAKSLASYTHPLLSKFFFCNSGAEANENALKLCIQKKKRKKLAAIKQGWHGRTLLCMSVTDDSKWHQQMNGWCQRENTIFLELNNINSLKLLTEEVGGVIIEPIQSMSGIYVASIEFLKALREKCDQIGAWLIFDEIQTGIGRTGLPFVSGFSGVTPDMTTLAKGLASGFPLGALCVTEEVSNTLEPSDLGTTFGAGPMAMAGLKASLDHISKIQIHKHVSKISEYLLEKLSSIPIIKAVRGQGLLLGLVVEGSAKEIQKKLIEKHILVGTSSEPHTLRLLPPLILEESHIDEFCAALTSV